MTLRAIIGAIMMANLCSCFLNAYYFERNAQIHNDPYCEIKLLYENIGKDYLRIYFIPKGKDTCNEYLGWMKATLRIKVKDTITYLDFESKSDTTTYNLANDKYKFAVKNKNNEFGTYHSAECCDCKSWFSHCMANLYYCGTKSISAIQVSINDTIWYNIDGEIISNNKSIEIHKDGIMLEGNVYGRPKPEGFKSR